MREARGVIYRVGLSLRLLKTPHTLRNFSHPPRLRSFTQAGTQNSKTGPFVRPWDHLIVT